MLTRLRLRNFKRFEDADIELGNSVVFIGPNNSGKTSALQALALWDAGLRLWNAKRGTKATPSKRPGVTINRRDLVSIPVPAANLLWRGLHTRDMQRVSGRPRTRNVRINVTIDGITNDRAWSCGLEFDYANEESFVCRPLRQPECEDKKVGEAEFSEIPEEATALKVAYLPPMSGLADREFIKRQGEISFLIGQGQTAQVLRNLCHQIYEQEDSTAWSKVTEQIQALFGVRLLEPEYVAERSEITMQYEEQGMRLDLSCSGRGLQQTLLLLAYLQRNPDTVLLMDEPDAHLEILRQRQTYRLLNEVAERQNSQVIAASHSEVVLNEAAGSGTVVAFVGAPHVLNDKGSQVLKALASIGWDQYYEAEETGWVLYLEGPSDLVILQAFAETLGHPASTCLERPFVHYVGNAPQKARDHFFGLREAKNDLLGIAIFDRLERELHEDSALQELMWDRREIENYCCREDVLMAWAAEHEPEDLFGHAEAQRRAPAIQQAIEEVTKLLEIDDKSPWSPDVKATDEVLDRIYRLLFKKLGLPLTFRKSDYHILARLVRREHIDPDVTRKLDAIVEIAKNASEVF